MRTPSGFIPRSRIAPGDGLTILLAEDDIEMRRWLCAELQEDGHVIACAVDGTEALEVLSGVRKIPMLVPDVIIMDVRLPGYSGLHVLAAMRAAEWKTPVILITAFGDRAVHEQGARLGAEAVFDKPFDIDDLRTALVNLRHPAGGSGIRPRVRGPLDG